MADKKDAVRVVAGDAADTLVIDAQASLQSVYEFAEAPEIIRRSLDGPPNWQVRNDGTVSQSLRSSSLAPRFMAVLLASGARAVLEGGEECPLEEYLEGSRKGQLSELRVPSGVSGRSCGESAVARAPKDEPIVYAVAVVDVKNGSVSAARLALTGAWKEAARLAEAGKSLVGRPLSDDLIEEVASAVEGEVSPPDNFLGTSGYRRAMAGVTVRRALGECRKEAK